MEESTSWDRSTISTIPIHLTAPWSLRSPDGRLTLRFTPFYDRVAKTDFKCWAAKSTSCSAHFHGTVQTDDGETIEIHDLVGTSKNITPDGKINQNGD